jgi:arylsulfatase A-like enzyme
MIKKIILLHLLAGLLTACQHEVSPPRPNIIYILADDLGYGDLGCLNPESRIETPHIDRLAEQGIRFTDAHSPSSVCSPTRYGILTGRYAWRTELKRSVLWAWDGPLIEPDRPTVGSFLQDQEYSTACIGKWHLGWKWQTIDGSHMNDSIPLGQQDFRARYDFGKKVDFSKPLQDGPITRGFEYYFGDDVPNFPPYAFIENDRVLEIPQVEKPDSMFGSPGPMREGWELDQVLPEITKKAVEYIKASTGGERFNRKKGQPFFLYFSLTAPHTPIAPSPEFKGRSRAGAYGDYVQEVDWVVGQVMNAVSESGQERETLLIFTSDNGSPARDGTQMSGPVNSVLRFGHHPSFIFRGTKADIWEGGHRVPFLAMWSGQIRPGSKSDETICLTSLMATLADILGVSLPEGAGEDSHSILKALMGGELPDDRVTVHHSIQGMFAVRKGNWKWIDGKGSGGWSEGGQDDSLPGQLYHLMEDPGEQINLFTAHQEKVRELQELLDSCKNER